MTQQEGKEIRALTFLGHFLNLRKNTQKYLKTKQRIFFNWTKTCGYVATGDISCLAYVMDHKRNPKIFVYFHLCILVYSYLCLRICIYVATSNISCVAYVVDHKRTPKSTFLHHWRRIICLPQNIHHKLQYFNFEQNSSNIKVSLNILSDLQYLKFIV